jgi:2OG-Fe(II) oxygenase superfamily
MHPLIISTKPDLSKLPGGWEPAIIPDLNDAGVPIPQHNSYTLIIDNLLSQSECDSLLRLMQLAPLMAPVNFQGNPKQAEECTGSLRVNLWSPELAKKIWLKIANYIEPINAHGLTLTDWWQGDKARNKWRPVAISPLLRFMRYENGGKHLPHYDAGFIYPDDNLRTLLSLIIYLTSDNPGGETRMIDDKQKEFVWSRNYKDWPDEANDNQVLCSCQPVVGRALLFLHRQCHDVAEYQGKGPRIIIRTDVIFEAVSELTHD